LKFNLKIETPIVFLGDVHGNWEVIRNFCARHSGFTIIQVGDFGIGFHHHLKCQSKLRKLNQHLADSNNQLLAIRGNHDDPDYFLGKHKLSNLYLLPDYTVAESGELGSILFAGGGVSIDRSERILNKSWWPDERPIYDESKIANCDILVTHAAPAAFVNACFYKDIDPHWWVQELLCNRDLNAILKEEKEIIQKISNKSNCKQHIFGHLHSSQIFIDSNAKRRYHCLDINEFKEIKTNKL
jgi:Icc-related predicted phosphoesterase